MKYSIFGFSQEEVLKCKTTIDVNGKEKEVYIDVTDLLILQCVADFMNRQHIYKYIINDKMYFSIQYKALLEDLPILNIGKQALRDRIDKLVLFNLLEKEVIRNEQGSFAVFRIGTRYEQLAYNKKDERVCSEIEGGVYQTTQGCVENYTTKNSSTINTSTIKEKKENIKRKKECAEPTEDEHKTFEEFRKAYKGKKRGHDTEFNFFISQNKDWRNILPLLGYAIEKENTLREQARLMNKFFPEQKNMQTYLNGKNRAWEVFTSDIEHYDASEYRPICDGISLFWNELQQCYITPFDVDDIVDGYTNANRPNGAVVVWRGYRYNWNSITQKWVKQ